MKIPNLFLLDDDLHDMDIMDLAIMSPKNSPRENSERPLIMNKLTEKGCKMINLFNFKIFAFLMGMGSPEFKSGILFDIILGDDYKPQLESLIKS